MVYALDGKHDIDEKELTEKQKKLLDRLNVSSITRSAGIVNINLPAAQAAEPLHAERRARTTWASTKNHATSSKTAGMKKPRKQSKNTKTASLSRRAKQQTLNKANN